MQPTGIGHIIWQTWKQVGAGILGNTFALEARLSNIVNFLQGYSW